MNFADIELSRRLEGAEAAAGVSFVEARRHSDPELGAEWIEVAGARAMFDGVTSPVTQTFGLGLFAEPSVDDLNRLELFYSERGADTFHEVSPLAGVQVFGILSARRYRPVELSNVMYLPLSRNRSSGVLNPRIQTRLAARGEEELWSKVSARGWSEYGEWQDFLLGLGCVAAASENAFCFLAVLDGQPAAAGLLRCHNGVALFGGASTVPEARRQGAQQALLEARMRLAVEHNCDLAMMCAQPGSASQRNAERHGFRIAYTRVKWHLAR